MIGTLIAGLIYLLACSAVTLLLPAAALQARTRPSPSSSSTLVDPALGPIVAALRRDRRAGRAQRLRPAAGGDAAGAGAGAACSRAGSRGSTATRCPGGSTSSRAGSRRCSCSPIIRAGSPSLFQFMVLVTTSVSIIFYLACALAGLKLAREGRIAASPGFVADRARRPSLYSLWAFYGAGIEASLWSLGDDRRRRSRSIWSCAGSRSSPAAAATPAASPESAA